MVYIGPPSCSFPRVIWYWPARVTSANLVAMPRKPDTHIQKTAPGPPRQIAPATPMIFPVPTVAARAVHRACRGVTAFSASLGADRICQAFPKSVSWGNPARTVRSSPVPRSSTIIGGPQMISRKSKSPSVTTPP